MPYIEEKNQRELFRKTIEEQLIGPGSDIFGFPPEEELISSSPRHNYYAGMLFSSAFLDNNRLFAINEDGKEDNDDDNTIIITKEDGGTPGDNGDETTSPGKDSPTPAGHVYSSTFPMHCGLTFCVAEGTDKVTIEVSYGKYDKSESRKIKLSHEEYSLIRSKIEECENDEELIEKFGRNFLTDKLDYSNNGVLTITQPLPKYNENGSQKGLLQTDFKKKIIGKFENGNQIQLQKLFRLLGNIYKRTNHNFEREINLNESEGWIKELELKYLLKQMPDNHYNGKKFVKFQIRNAVESKKARYQDCLFQIKLKVRDVSLLPYHEPLISAIDEDFNVIEYQYQDEKTFGKGSNCAVIWEQSDNPEWIETSFLPEADVKAFSNNARPGAGNTDVLALHDLSVWSSLDSENYLNKLTSFADDYKSWTDNAQREKINTGSPDQQHIGRSLIKKQKNTYKRLIKNIDYLKNNEKALLCFKLANTAMLIQMVVARDSRFEKNRDIDSVNGNTYKDINFFKCYAANNVEKQPSYRPFQLAFLLMNVESTFNQESEDRTNIVDLIWFPTGGGKTEAYLALTALTILKRRIENVDDNTTAVIMRYTLRLLTSQQFERATYLICALEFLRENVAGLNVKDLSLGNEKLSIGMWVGSTTSPNNIHDLKANSYYNDFFEEPTEEKNRFPITYCPWCGVKLTLPSGEKNDYGYVLTKNALTLICQNNNCFFHGQDDRVLPVAFIDEQLYNAPPTLLFATVDKMVQLSHKDEPGKFFDQQLPPELIIQDELHLLTGPLGSMTGLYETLIQILCTTDKYKPKIVASTATTRNTHKIIRMMYGRELNIFPPQGVRYNDNYFSFVEKESKRKHIGLVPAGKSSVTTEIKLVEAIYLAKARLLQEYLGEHDIEYLAANEQKGALKNQVDPFWTLVLYYNSLRDLGRSNSRVSQEFKEYIRGKYTSFGLNDTFEFIHGNIFSRSVEFTSRQDSGKIKGLLSRMEKSISFNANDGKIFEDNDCIDLALASNMFSVGIDVDRLNLMMVMGQPNSVSEYIQATSRVARKSKGLVVNMYSTMRTREMSFYENFTGFHNTYYKNVEPLSITPYTEVAVDKLLNALLVGFVRQKLNKKPQAFSADDAVSFYHEIADRIPDPIQKNYIRSKLDTLANSWIQLKGAGFNYTTLLKNPDFILMNSLRDIDPDLFMKNSDLDYTPNYQ